MKSIGRWVFWVSMALAAAGWIRVEYQAQRGHPRKDRSRITPLDQALSAEKIPHEGPSSAMDEPGRISWNWLRSTTFHCSSNVSAG